VNKGKKNSIKFICIITWYLFYW